MNIGLKKRKFWELFVGGKIVMSTSVSEVLEQYIEAVNHDDKTKERTLAEDAKVLNISIGTLSQLRNGKAEITDRVIDKIAKKLAADGKYKEEDVVKKLQETRISQSSPTTAIEVFHQFFETKPDVERLICFAYRDIPQTRDQGKYPDYIYKYATVIKNGLTCAFFQPFGPIEEIKNKAISAITNGDTEAIDRWNFIYKVADGVHEVFQKTKIILEDKSVANDITENKGQIVLYESAHLPSLINCIVHSRLFYSYQISEINEVRIAQLIQEKDEERFIECSTDQSFQTAIATQFYPIVNYWLKEKRLPVKQSEIKGYYDKNEKIQWNIFN